MANCFRHKLSTIISLCLTLLIAACGGGGGGGGGTGSTGTTAVSGVTALAATPGDTWVSLSWTNPSGIAGVMVRRDVTCPSGPTAGTLVADTAGTTALDTGLTNGTNYCYTAFAHDASGNYSTGLQKYARPFTSYQAIAAGGIHTLAIKADGTLWAWGYNYNGQIGDGCVFNASCFDRQTELQVGTSSAWTAVSAGTTHSVAINGGTLWSWGDNSSNQIGNGCPSSTCSYVSTPTQISATTGWAAISAGGFFTVALKTDGTLWAWGSNNSGALGDGCTASTCAAKTVPTQIGTATNWAAVAAGAAHVIALKTDGTLWAWGDNAYGQMGNGANTPTLNSVPVQIGTATNWRTIAAGDLHSLAIKTDGTLWAWGSNANGQLGISCGGCTAANVPTQVGVDTDWLEMDGGRALTLARKTTGTLWAWGFIATPTGTQSSVPLQVGTGTAWTAISAGGGGGYSGIGGGHFLALEAMTPSGHHLYGWGTNTHGALGLGNMMPVWTPTLIQ